MMKHALTKGICHMRTEEDFLRLEAENRVLRDRLASLANLEGELKRQIAEFLAPKPRQQPERQAALRVLASLAGMPSLCGRRECRRKGACLAEDDPPPCREFWSKALTARFADIAAGMDVSAFRRQQEDADFHAWACEQMGLMPDGTPAGGKPPREKRKKAATA